MAVNDTHSVALVQEYESYKPVNVFHYIETVDGGGDSNLSLNAAFNTAVISSWAACVSDFMKLLCLISKTIDPAPTVPNILSPLAATEGTKIGSAMPGQTQATVRKYPGAGSSPYLVGHFNVGGTVEADWLEGNMEAALKANLDTLAVALEGTLVSGGYTFEPVIWSPTRKKASTPPFSIGWDSHFVNFGVKVLRRRRGFYHAYA